MCPISGMVQFLIVIVTLLLLCHAALVHSYKITFDPKNITIQMYDHATVNYNITYESGDSILYSGDYEIYSQKPDIANVENTILLKSPDPTSGILNITGNFLGETKFYCKIKGNDEPLKDDLDVIVIRKKRIIDTVFTASVATLVSIIYINFGCVLKWGELIQNLKRPIGPCIGFLGQFLVMPLLSFFIGRILFPESPEMQLGMFFTGVSPAGGASNIWTVILEGNVDLSITMTTISTLSAFAMMPLWIFTLGRVIFDEGKLGVPYREIGTYAIALVIPLAIGWLITRYLKRLAQFLARILKGLSSLLILFIVVFAIVTNLYLFQLFSWKIIIAGMGLPYLGYGLGYLMAFLFRQPAPDRLAIAIETGIQNTGIAIFLLRFALPQPQADLTTVAPVAVAIMTPFPLIFLYFYKLIMGRIYPNSSKKTFNNSDSSKNMIDDNLNTVDENLMVTRLSANKIESIS